MLSKKIITTSWDDGHPSDLRVAELLDKYNLQGTFYVPRSNPENEVMEERHVKSLAKSFEVGGHTLNHVRLNVLAAAIINDEIDGCYAWLADVVGDKPLSFCFPGGVYNQFAIERATNAGFKILRTTNLLSLSGINVQDLLPTTIQLFHHSALTYCGHLLKRVRMHDLMLLLKNYSRKGLVGTVEKYIRHVYEYNGVFHLWGHSWELDENSLWKETELIFQVISNLDGFRYVPNSALVECYTI